MGIIAAVPGGWPRGRGRGRPRRQMAKTSIVARLPEAERLLCQVLAAFDGSGTISGIGTALARLGLRVGGRQIDLAGTRALVGRLVASKLLPRVDTFTLADAVRHEALLLAQCEGRLTEIRGWVDVIRPGKADWATGVRNLRLELHCARWDQARDMASALPRQAFEEACRPFDPEWVAAFPPDLRQAALGGIVERATALLEATAAQQRLEAEQDLSDGVHRVLVERLLWQERYEDAARALTGRPSLEADVGRAFLAFLGGRTHESIALYEVAHARMLKVHGKKSWFPDRAGLFYVVALIAEGSPGLVEQAARLSAVPRTHALATAYDAMANAIASLRTGAEPEDLELALYSVGSHSDPLEVLIGAAACAWSKVKLPKALRDELEARRDKAQTAGLTLYAAQAQSLLTGKPRSGGGPSLGRLVATKERWVATLDALLALVGPAAPLVTQAPRERRLAWVVGTHLQIEPREQVWVKGAWSKGKRVALQRLRAEARTLPFLTAVDVAVSQQIESVSYGRYGDVAYDLPIVPALEALAGQDNVLIEDRYGELAPCEIRVRAPCLQVVDAGGHLEVSMDPRPVERQSERLTRVGAHTLEIVAFRPEHLAIARLLGKKALVVPRDGDPRLREVLRALSSRIEVRAELPADPSGVSKPADARPYVSLLARGDGLFVRAQVRPLGPEGPAVVPGHGGGTIFATVQGTGVRLTRDLGEETRRLSAVIAACPALAGGRIGPAEFLLEDRTDALDALVELQQLGDAVIVDGSKAPGFVVSSPLGLDRARLSVEPAPDGFVATLTLEGGQGSKLALAEIADYLSASPGRYLRLSGDRGFLALSRELRDRLDDLFAFGRREGARLRISTLVAPLLAELFPSLTASTEFEEVVARAGMAFVDPPVPKALCADLRPYQREGFRWLARLASRGAGAILADEMGLGKTVQALALLVHRAALGPALVVAPTSVVLAWVDEIARFAPTLRVRAHLAGAPADLDELGAHDVLVTSYALLGGHATAFAARRFGSVVLDEAQMIKNRDTARARAAARLTADVRVATTGTPIENRLEDLQGIMGWANPGLLGSSEAFTERFARPIERGGDTRARDRLRRLISPFILRRTKTQVSPELPARTEVTLRVPLEREEMALYEAVRAESLRMLASGKSGRMKLFAAITRLRQAASHPRLVDPASEATSAKLAALGDLLDELLPSGHRALVFSQFVGLLSLVRESLTARGVRLQYLDGSTPAVARRVAVEAFQRGEGDVFLISLKAGGFGLNLTGADYVVHLDPWWNPATEDQASDRAHRLGQTRPVTIYRLVGKDTIEDRIVALHHRKRELAAGILEGADRVGGVTDEELVALIRGS